MSKKSNHKKQNNKQNNIQNNKQNNKSNKKTANNLAQKQVEEKSIKPDKVEKSEDKIKEKDIVKVQDNKEINLSIDIEENVIIEKETSIMDDIKANIILWSLLSVLFVVLLIAIVVTNLKDKDDDNSKETTTIEEETSTEEETTIEDGTVLPEAENSPIVELIKNYLKASRIDVSMEDIEKYVDSTDNISLADNEILKKYIQEYQNVECYVLKSSKPNTNIVVTTYGCKFNNIETAAPGCEAFIVVVKDGKYLVHNLTVQETIDTYISSDIDRKTINEIMDEINSCLNQALEMDEELKNVINVIIGEE